MTKHRDFLSLTKARKTTYEFGDRKISRQSILTILQAAQWSPSCGNKQLWRFMVVQDEQTILRLVDTTHSSLAPFVHPLPPVMIAFILLPQNKQAVGSTPMSCCGYKLCKLHEHEHELSLAMSVLSATLAATDLGIQSCILTPPADQASKILHPQNKGIVRLLVGLGYENKNAYQKERSRLPLDQLITWYKPQKKSSKSWRTKSS